MVHTACPVVVARKGPSVSQESNRGRSDRNLNIQAVTVIRQVCFSSPAYFTILVSFILRRHACFRYGFISGDFSVVPDTLIDLTHYLDARCSQWRCSRRASSTVRN
jgi:hypothetical protein